MVQWIRSLSFNYKIHEKIQNTILGFKSSRCQSIKSHIELFFLIYIRCPTGRLLCCGILLHILIIFLFRITCGYSVFSFQIKKTEGFSGCIREYLAKVKSIPLLQMHDLLEILEYAFSLFVDFPTIHKTTCYKTIWAKSVCSNNTFHCH